MAGFLDRNTRVLDMVLTNPGKTLLSRGQLRFCYWIPFDDEIVYTPYIAESGSLTPAQLSASIDLSIENSFVREATTGYRVSNSSGSDQTNLNRPMFTMPQGQDHIPRALFPVHEQRTLTTTQRRVQRVYKSGDESGAYLNAMESVDLGTERLDSTLVAVELSYSKDSFSPDFKPDGFLIRVMKSGSSGLTEVYSKRDLRNDLCYGSDVRVFTGRRR